MVMGYFSEKRNKEAGQKTGDRTHSGSGSLNGSSGLKGCSGLNGSSGLHEGMYGAADMGMLPAGELSEERDFRMLQGMYPREAKELLELIGEECDRLEYEGSPMFDEYPDYTTIYTLQKRIADAAQKKSETVRDGADMGAETEDGDAGGDAVPEDLIRVMLLQEMHRRRSRYRACRGVL